MLIIIPTYRRTNCLQWVLQSLVQCQLDGVPGKVRVLVVNNYPPAADEVAEVVSRFAGIKEFIWKLNSRPVSLDPVENWYSAIRDEAQPGEIVMLQGDDDLFLPWALVARHRLFEASKADFFLTEFIGRLFFSRDGATAWYSGQPTPAPKHYDWAPWDRLAPNGPEPSFIGNHVYRANACLWQGLQRALAACSSQTWCSKRDREMMLPYYLPFAIADAGGKVCQSPLPCVVRGADAQEVVKAPFGVANWNTCHVELLALALFRAGVFGREPVLQDYITRRFEHSVRALLPVLFDDARLDRGSLQEALRQAGLRRSMAFSPASWKGWRAVIVNRFGLTGRKLNSQMARHSVPTQEFVQSLMQPPGQHKYE